MSAHETKFHRLSVFYKPPTWRKVIGWFWRPFCWHMSYGTTFTKVVDGKYYGIRPERRCLTCGAQLSLTSADFYHLRQPIHTREEQP